MATSHSRSYNSSTRRTGYGAVSLTLSTSGDGGGGGGGNDGTLAHSGKDNERRGHRHFQLPSTFGWCGFYHLLDFVAHAKIEATTARECPYVILLSFRL